ncbi:basement membrane-specific heparan sulfate proteoglycan core protein-like isoform X2 [Perca fluviatilis]|uniref:basement membrane-specific heparan sulfate proteoglycan core protein-like isoform X2 n=1 Tax=Perca fluviatilis TaxID=8168 RepID=UPI001964F12C|nr:basement membrane-specific heparan sulfate proteoglycan core protein-like isoform X2 [Perca fluviatilis]
MEECLTHRIGMFVLIWASLLFAVRSNNANAVASPEGRECSQNGICVTLSETEITAEAGLCAVIPCSFTTDGFSSENAVWYKCDPSKHNCTDLDITLRLNKPNAQPKSRRQVSLLEPDLSQNNCSIIINDVTKSDSGSYHLTDVFLNETTGHTSPRVTITVTGLTQKPTVMIPPLTEGQQSTLSCTAPGLCSGSVPEISWTWRGAGEKDSHITGNITAFRTENLTAVTQRHSSTLTFNSSAEHHDTNVSCKVSFTNNITTEETVTLNVTYVKEVNITGDTSVKDRETLNLTCSVESFPPSLITWTKLGLNRTLNNDTGTATLVIPNVTAEYSGQYICTVKHQNNTLTEEVNITVIYAKKPVITGMTTVKEGEALNLTCGVESFPPSGITWTKRGSNNNLQKETRIILQNDTGSATLVILNVTAEYSGQYICTAEHQIPTLTTHADVIVTYVKRVTITGNTSVKDRETLNLTCSVESFPPSLITWTKLGLSGILNNDTGTATLVIPNVTAEYFGQYICTAKHQNNTLTEEVNITVIYAKKPVITGMTTVKEGDALNLTCGVESFPPSVITWTKRGSNNNLQKETGIILQNDTGSATLVILNVTAEYSGQYICTAKHQDNTVTEEVNITVIYVKKSEITGKTTVKEGDALNLTCNVESVPPSLVMWTEVPSNQNPNKGADTHLQNNTGSATLFIHNVTAEHNGQYICTAKHLDTTLTMHAKVTVTFYPKILNSSGCINQSEVLTCVCISEGFPLPTITWPLLENHTRYSVITTVSHHTVNSTVTLTVKDHSNTSVECVSSNHNGEVKRNLILNKVEEEDQNMSVNVLTMITRLEIIIAFLIGALLSAIICCLVRKCHRKQRVYVDMAETLEMMTLNGDPLIDGGEAVEDYQAIDQVATEAGGAVVADKSDVEYSKIDFSQIKRKTPTEAGTAQGTTETEYAEIKESKKMKEEAEETQEEEGREEMIREGEETKHCVSEDKECEVMVLYSNVQDIMSQI